MKNLHLVVRSVTESTACKELNSKFECPSNNVIVGRKHTGDENGETVYKYGALEFENTEDAEKYVIVFLDSGWSKQIKESAAEKFQCLNGHMIVGREHIGDENGMTRYKTSRVVIVKKLDVEAVSDIPKEIKSKESDGTWVQCTGNDGTYKVMTGRQHTGDENGATVTSFANLVMNIKEE